LKIRKREWCYRVIGLAAHNLNFKLPYNGGTMEKATLKNDGFAIVYGLAVFFLASVSGLSILYISQKDRTCAGDYSKVRSSALSARAALCAFEKQCEDQPLVILDILKKYSIDHSNKWLLGDNLNAGSENKIKCWNGSDAPSFSACIMKYDSVNLLLQVQGIGYCAGGGKKKAIGIYRLKGALEDIVWDQNDAIHLAGEGRNFDNRITVNGNVYCGGDLHFNSGANGSIINGDLKTGISDLTSSFDINVTVNGKAFFQSPVKLNGALTINGKSGFQKNIYTDGALKLKGDTYLNSTVNGNQYLDLCNNKATHSGSASRIINASQIINNHGTIDIANELNMRDGNELSFTIKIDQVGSKIQNWPSWGTIKAETLNQKYQQALANGDLWNDFLVYKVSNYANMESSAGTFTGKVIWIVESGIACNGNWYDCAASSNTLVYVKSGGSITGMGSNKNFRGYIYVEGNGDVNYLFGNGNSFRGAIHHVSKNSKFQLNSGAPLNILYDREVLKELVRFNVITPPGVTSKALVLNDVKLRTELLSLYY